MKRTLVFTAIVASSLAFAGEVKMKISGSAGLTGTATVINKLQEDGSKYVRMEMELRSTDGQIANVMQESVYDKSGMPVRMIQNTEAKGTKTQKIVANFELGTVRLRISDGGNTDEQILPITPGINMLAKYEFWFLRDEVKPGGKTTYFRFDVQTAKWEKVEATFQGSRQITIGGKPVKANLVTINDTKAYVDEKGDPLRVESAGVVLERVSS